MEALLGICMIAWFVGFVTLAFGIGHHCQKKLAKYIEKNCPERLSEFGFGGTFNFFVTPFRKYDIEDPELARLWKNVKNVFILTFLWGIGGFMILCLLALLKQYLDAVG